MLSGIRFFVGIVCAAAVRMDAASDRAIQDLLPGMFIDPVNGRAFNAISDANGSSAPALKPPQPLQPSLQTQLKWASDRTADEEQNLKSALQEAA